MVALELEVMAKKLDRFGWERDRGTAAHDRMVTDWMDALQDYPLDEVQAACRAHVLAKPRVMPNEGDIVVQIMDARRRHVASLPKPIEPAAVRKPVSKDEAAAILAKAGFSVRRVPE